jgi:hypothetical protein
VIVPSAGKFFLKLKSVKKLFEINNYVYISFHI